MYKKTLTNKIISISLATTLMISGLVGCTSDGKKTEEVKGNNNRVEESTTRTITDMLGRKVVIPKKVNKILSTSPIATVAVYAINPDKLAGTNLQLNDITKKYTTKEYHNVPFIGKEREISDESILDAKPDLIISMGNLDTNNIKDLDERQERLSIPHIAVDGNLENSPKAYEFLGKLLSEEKRTKELSDYCKKVLEETKSIANEIPEEKKLKVYFGQGKGGLSTNSKGSIHTEVIDIVGGINVVEARNEGHGRTEVSIEQILNWNPDKIIAVNNVREEILNNTSWDNIKALKEGQVYEIPSIPFNWFDMPPSPARILGIKWLGNLLYPEYFNFDIKEESKEYFEKFYHLKITDEDLEEILNNSLSK